jgi:hypothetical protein
VQHLAGIAREAAGDQTTFDDYASACILESAQAGAERVAGVTGGVKEQLGEVTAWLWAFER